MKIFRILLISFGIFFFLLFTIPLILPTSSYVEKSIVIHKPIDDVFDYALDLHNYQQWSSWTHLDKTAKFEVIADSTGFTHKIQWTGDTLGDGYLVRRRIVRDSIIVSDMILIKPWDSKAVDIMKFEPTLDGVKVSWANKMQMDYPFGRYMGLVMESFLGDDYQKGLQKLKTFCEGKIKSKMFDISEIESISMPVYYIRDTTSLEPKKLQNKLGMAYAELTHFYETNKLDKPISPIAITNNINDSVWHFDAGFAAADTSLKVIGRVKKDILASNKVLKCVYIGPYSNGKLAYAQIHNYMQIKSLVANGRPWEIYINDPANTADSLLITHIYYPVKYNTNKMTAKK